MKRIKNYAPVLVTAFLICLPLLALAEPNLAPGGNSGVPLVPGGSTGVPYTPGGSTGNGPSGSQFSVQNPLTAGNFCELIKTVLNALMVIGLPVAVLFMVIVGFKYILAQGKPEAIAEANKNFFYTVIGIGVFLGAWTIAKIIAETMRQLGVTGFTSC